MSEVYLFQLASQRTQWLNARQSIIASNVANANTPGFRAQDLAPFSSILDKTAASMSVTNASHIDPETSELNAFQANAEDGADTTLSGNSVNLESEMIKIGDISRDASAANAIKKTFHQMMLEALK